MVVKVVKFSPKTIASAKKKASKPSHPPTSQIVVAAIKSLKERNGSSLQAIKKYISASYKIDADKLAPFIKKFLKAAVASGKLIQTKGKGASGSFKLSKAEKKVIPKKAKKSAVKKVKKAKAPKAKSGTKIKQKVAKPKKVAVSKKPKSVKAKKPVAVKNPVGKKASPKKK